MTSPHDQRRRALVRPPDWTNPTPEDTYDLLVIGAGSAGLVCASGGATLGARTALVERLELGGDCLNTGCVPSKSIIASARTAARVRDAGDHGIEVGEVSVDFPAVMERMRARRADVAEHDAAQRFADLGIDVYLGEGCFTGPDTFEVDGRSLRFRRAVIATGARPAMPPIDGLADSEPLTSDTIWDLDASPGSLLVLGGGPIGCELAQAFARLGVRVELVERSDRLLGSDDRDAALVVMRALLADGVSLHLETEALAVRRTADGVHVEVEGPDGVRELSAGALLVALGRRPNVESLSLDAAGVELDDSGRVRVDDAWRTTNSRVYAAGDVASPLQFTHAADAGARRVLRNALFPWRDTSELLIPWCTYTDPEVAHVGPVAAELSGRDGVESVTVQHDHVDRAITDGRTEGFLRVHVEAGSDTMVAATAVGPHAGETIGELCTAMTQGIGLKALGDVVRPYPTAALAIRAAADQLNRERLTDTTRTWLRRWFALWRRLGG